MTSLTEATSSYVQNESQSMTRPSSSRRNFLIQSSSAIIAATACAGVSRGTTVAGDRLRLASIGVGGMGASDLGSLSSHALLDVVALCDVDANNLAAAGERHPKAKRFTDFRRMFDAMADEIDAVSVSTPDHTHAAAAMTAMNHGKHVYCQKPLTHDVYESRQLKSVAEKDKLVTQMGTQIHSASPYRTAVKLVQSGVIGKIRETHSWSNKTWGYEGPDPEPSPIPASLDWDLWLGTAAERPFSQGHFHPGNWRRWYDFGCGTMGDMAIHILDPVFTALQLGAPLQILSSSSDAPKKSFGMQNHTRYSFPASSFTTSEFLLTWSDGGKMPDTSEWPLEGPDGKPLGLPDQGSIFIGEKGAILLPHVAMPLLLPLKNFADYKIEAAPDGNHYHLFVDACLGGAPTTAHFGYAGPLTEAVLLGTIANRFPGSHLAWDSERIVIPNHDQANALLRRSYRKGFEVENLT
jgi:predicted dehydrogenase